MSLRRGRLQSDPRRKAEGGTAISERRQPISKASPAQRAEVDGDPCVHCGRWPTETSPNDAMHLAARGYRGGCNEPDCVVAGCRWCHRDFDAGKLDLSTDVAGARFAEKLAHMLEHYDGDWIAMGERLVGVEREVVVVDRETGARV